MVLLNLNKGLLISLFIFLAIFFAFFISLSDNFTYCLDDTYIHMGIAKNFVKFNNWGSSIEGFESSTSSPIWTFLISIFFFILGVNDFVPLIINFILSIALIISIAHILRTKFKFKEFESYIYSLIIFLLIPGFVMVFIGMEHLLHIFLTLWFIYFFLEVYFENKNHNLFYTLTFLMGAIRYESLFLLIPINLLLLYRKNYKTLIIFSLVMVLPIIIYGLISLSNGSDFLPNSILVKGFNGILLLKFKIDYLLSLVGLPLIFSIILLFTLRNHENKKVLVLLFIISFLVLLQTIFASFGWFMRYEAWIMSIFIICLFVLFKDLFNFRDKKFSFNANDKKLLFVLFIIILIFCKFILSNFYINTTSQNIYDSNVIRGKFILEYYNHKTIVLHDLGCPSYYADVNVIDLNGLATNEVQKKIRDGSITREYISEITKDADIAFVFKDENILIFDTDSFNWTPIGYYIIPDMKLSEYNEVYIYAIKENPEKLRENFVEYFSKTGLEYYLIE